MNDFEGQTIHPDKAAYLGDISDRVTLHDSSGETADVTPGADTGAEVEHLHQRLDRLENNLDRFLAATAVALDDINAKLEANCVTGSQTAERLQALTEAVNTTGTLVQSTVDMVRAAVANFNPAKMLGSLMPGGKKSG